MVNCGWQFFLNSYLDNKFLYLNIRSIRNKCDDLNKVVGGNIDILSMEETKQI